MNTKQLGGESCDRVLDHLDSYIDRELASETTSVVAGHLDTCAACAAEFEARRALRTRLKIAARSISVSPNLQHRIRLTTRTKPQWTRPVMAIAAMAALCISGAIAYQLGHLRLTVASQERYIGSISQRVGSLMSVGLGDHVHCSVFRKQSKTPNPPEKMIAEMGPQYQDLIPVVKNSIPEGFVVMTAHQCRYQGRLFWHVSATNGSRLISLVISRKGEGETFTRENLAPALSEAGTSIYQAGVQRFEVAGFETRDHLVYVVSETSARENIEIITAMSKGIRTVLGKLES